jgi:hypothetical protein
MKKSLAVFLIITLIVLIILAIVGYILLKPYIESGYDKYKKAKEIYDRIELSEEDFPGPGECDSKTSCLLYCKDNAEDCQQFCIDNPENKVCGAVTTALESINIEDLCQTPEECAALYKE